MLPCTAAIQLQKLVKNLRHFLSCVFVNESRNAELSVYSRHLFFLGGGGGIPPPPTKFQLPPKIF
jgi:hypothetical protein